MGAHTGFHGQPNYNVHLSTQAQQHVAPQYYQQHAQYYQPQQQQQQTVRVGSGYELRKTDVPCQVYQPQQQVCACVGVFVCAGVTRRACTKVVHKLVAGLLPAAPAVTAGTCWCGRARPQALIAFS